MRAFLVAAFALLTTPAFAAAGDPIEGVVIIVRDSASGALVADEATGADGKAVFKLPVRGYRITFVVPPGALSKNGASSGDAEFLKNRRPASTYHAAISNNPGLNVRMFVSELDVEISPSATGTLSADLVLAFDETVTIRVIEGLD